ncbi:MAG: cysteine dioxygenase family protein [Owenweeksia sp.]|nr:cysteine dioxygenase family protein [Owenweeksia sp.]
MDSLVYNLSLGPGYSGFTKMVEAIDLPAEELAKVCQWHKDRYQRIRIYDTEGLEALVTCWEPGQKGLIHNYKFQQGWLKILKGELKLEYFMKPTQNPKPYNTTSIKKGEVSYLNDNLGYHRFANHGKERCVALHFYSDKIKRWQVFDEDSGKIEEIETTCDRSVEI